MKFSALSIGILSSFLLAACAGGSPDEQQASSSSSAAPLTIPLSSSSTARDSSSSSAVAFDPESFVAYADSCTKPVGPLAFRWRYEDAERGVILQLPDTGDTGFPDYEKTDDGLTMGPKVTYDDGTGCATEHAFTVKYLPKRGAEEAQREIIAGYESHAMPTPDQGWGVNLVMVDRRAAVQWGIGDWACPMPTLEIPGEKVNVQISTSCHYPKTPLQAADDLEQIMQVMEFTGGDVQ